MPNLPSLHRRLPLSGYPPRVVDVIPRDIQKDRLDRNRRHLRRELDDVRQVHAFRREIVQKLHEGRTHDVRVAGGGLGGAQVVNVDDGAVALQLAVEEAGEGGEGLCGDLDGEGGGTGGRGGGDGGGRLLGGGEGVVDEGEGVGDVADDGVGAADGEVSER